MDNENRSCIDCGSAACRGKGGQFPPFCRTEHLDEALLERSLEILKGEENAFSVAAAVNEEVAGHLLGSRNTVGTEVAGQHTARNVDCQDDIDTFRCRTAVVFDILRTGQRHDDQRHGRTPQYERQMPQKIFHCPARAAQGTQSRNAYRRAAPQRAIDVECRHRQQDDKQPQQLG